MVFLVEMKMKGFGEMRKALVTADSEAKKLQIEVIMLKLMKGEEEVKVSKKSWCSFSVAIVVLVVLGAAFVAAFF